VTKEMARYPVKPRRSRRIRSTPSAAALQGKDVVTKKRKRVVVSSSEEEEGDEDEGDSEDEEDEDEGDSDEDSEDKEDSTDYEPSSSETEEDKEDDDSDDSIFESLSDAVLVGLIDHLVGKANKTISPLPAPKISAKRKMRKKSSSEIAPPFVPTSLKSLIDLAVTSEKRHFRDCGVLHSLLVPLQELQNLIGMESLKMDMVEFILLHLQQPQLTVPNMRHVILTGSPGCGKTTVAGIIGRIMCRLGGNDTDHVIFGTQGNMTGEYLGQTAPKTEALIRKAFGGVLVLDEASSLADGRKSSQDDSFSKSCIDTLNRMLSEHGDKFVCILAGYKTEIFRDILTINPGMSRRFSTRFELDNYGPEDLRQITCRKLSSDGYVLSDEGKDVLTTTWFKENLKHFSNFGGDCENMVALIVRAHSLRVFGQCTEFKMTLSRKDVQEGMARHLVLGQDSKPKNEMLYRMYT
jgi:stage V sporulation protein K